MDCGDSLALDSGAHSGPSLDGGRQLSTAQPISSGSGRGGGSGGGGGFNLRGAFVAPPGKVLLAADYSQIELRMLAHLAGDQKLIALLRRAGDGGDVFKAMWNAGRVPPLPPDTAVTPGDREKAKRTVYGILFGQGKVGLAEKLGVSQPEAAGFMAALFNAFPGVKRFLQVTKASAAKTRMVLLPSGRHRPLPGFASKMPSERAESERKAVNTLVQGMAADMVKAAMLRWVSAVSTGGPPFAGSTIHPDPRRDLSVDRNTDGGLPLDRVHHPGTSRPISGPRGGGVVGSSTHVSDVIGCADPLRVR
jgi:hypothetical protein